MREKRPFFEKAHMSSSTEWGSKEKRVAKIVLRILSGRSTEMLDGIQALFSSKHCLTVNSASHFLNFVFVKL